MSIYSVYKYAQYITRDQLYDLAYPLSYSSTGSISATSLLSSCLNSLVTNTFSISKSVTAIKNFYSRAASYIIKKVFAIFRF
jgi:hypothetical protein